MAASESHGWDRVGAAVREARVDMGYRSRDTFAEASDVSVRVIADLESGARSNFSAKILSRVESALGWQAGTIDQLVTDPTFVLSPTSPRGDLVFHAPEFDRRPVAVDVAVVERAIAALTEAARELKGTRPKAPVQHAAEAAVGLCWPYVIRLVEDNCLPGNELHPAVRPLYETFLNTAATFCPADPQTPYVRWLAGDLTETSETVQRRHMQRWSESRRVRRGRRLQSAPEIAAD